MSAPTDSVSMKSVFADVFDDNKPIKIALYHFMDQFALSVADKDAVPNFISMAPHYRKRFYVPSDEIPRMMKLLKDCLDANIDNHFYELQDVNPVDDTDEDDEGVSGLFFEFRFTTSHDVVDFGKVVQPFIRLLFNELLMNIIDFDVTIANVLHYCFYMSSAKPTYDATKLMYHSTFRIIIPSIMLDPRTRFYVHRKVWKNANITQLFDNELNYPLKKCFQPSARVAPVPLYGSCDIDQMERMCLNKIFKLVMRNGRTSGETVCVDAVNEKIINMVHSISINHPEEGGVVNKTAYDLTEEAYDKMEREMNDGRLFQMAHDEAYSTYLQMLVIDDDIKHMRAMLELLDNSRFASVESWIEIIRSLAADPETNRYHCLAVMITKDRNHLIKTDGKRTPITWETFEQCWYDAISSTDRSLYSPDSINYWARIDSPSEMHRYTMKTIRTMMIRDIRHPLVRGKINHSQVASYLHFMFKNAFATKDVPKSVPDWYEFVTPRTRDIEVGQVYKWRRIGSQPDSLAIYMVTEFKEIATAIYTDMKAMCVTEENKEKDPRQKIINDLSKAFLTSIQMIFNHGAKKSVIDEASSLFKRNTFINHLDKTPHIVGVGNGVLEFSGANAKLIQYFHTYPISLFTDTKYVPYDPNSKYVKTIYRMLRSLVPDDEMDALEFLLYYFCTSLDGMPKESLFLIIHGGGCHAIDTPIRMYDGSVKMVQDVCVGDKLMGDDDTPRTVQELFRGTDEMYRIVPKKGGAFEVNKDHVLSIRFTGLTSIEKRSDGSYATNPKYRTVWCEYNDSNEPTRRSMMVSTKEEAQKLLDIMAISNSKMIKKGDIMDIKVKDLLTWHSHWLKKGNVTLYKSSGVSYAEKKVSIDPYLLGYWLGDGHSRGPMITTMDTEVIDSLSELIPASCTIKPVEDAGRAKVYRIGGPGKKKPNPMLDSLRAYDLIQNKHIPNVFKQGSTDQRLALLAGIIDSDGHFQKNCQQYELTLKNERLFDDVIELVRSLGFAAYKHEVKKSCTNGKNGPVEGTYFRMNIYGSDLARIPCKVLRKQAPLFASAKAHLTDSFSIEPIGQGNYYGFELDGNHRYLDGDFYVHHNSNGKTVLMELFKRTLGELYVRKMPLSFITEQNRTSSASADPAIMELKNARLVYYSESDRNEKVNVAKVKEITGGETLSGRHLFKEQENFNANCNHIVTTNHRFVIETTEHAVWRRFMSYKFKICFKNECNPNDPLERPRDPALIDKIKSDKRYQEAFLSILIHYRSKLYSQYEGQILKVPHPTIIRETDQYRQEEDVYQRYIMNNVYYSEGTVYALEHLVNNFREFYRLEGSGSYTGKTADTIHIFRNSLLQPYCKDDNGKHVLVNFRSFSVSEGIPSSGITFAAWQKGMKVRKGKAQHSGEQ